METLETQPSDCWCDDKAQATCNAECARIRAVEDFAGFLRRVIREMPGTLLEVEAKSLLFLHGYDNAR